MATATLTLEGVDTFKADLENLPPALAAAARKIVYDAAEATARELHGAYPPRRPKSRSRFMPLAEVWRVYTRNLGDLHPRAIVTHLEMLARWYEVGTPERFARTTAARALPRGLGRRAAYTVPRGRMPAAPTFVPIMVRRQRGMANDLTALFDNTPFTVQAGGR